MSLAGEFWSICWLGRLAGGESRDNFTQRQSRLIFTDGITVVTGSHLYIIVK